MAVPFYACFTKDMSADADAFLWESFEGGADHFKGLLAAKGAFAGNGNVQDIEPKDVLCPSSRRFFDQHKE
eukprot:10202049-Alexandrium_andersonii.AAC.1